MSKTPSKTAKTASTAARRPKRMTERDVPVGETPQETHEITVQDRLEARQAAKLSSLSEILHAEPQVELDELADTLLAAFSPAA